MNFNFTEEQLAMQKVFREFAEKEVAPGAIERDQTEAYPRDLFEKMAKLGFFGIAYPKEYGGAGMGYLTYTIAAEEIAKACASAAIILAVNTSLCAEPIFRFGTEEQKQKYLIPLIKGDVSGAFSLTEPEAGSDSAAQKTTAVKEGNKYILNGKKIFTTNGGEASTYIVFAMTGNAHTVKDISAFIVEKNFPGISFGRIEKKMGIRSAVVREVFFENCEVPEENLLGKVGRGFIVAMKTLDGGRIGVAAQALGIAESAYSKALNYAKKRQQFGKPIAANQAISFMLADMYMQIEAARYLTYKAAFLKDNGMDYATEAAAAKCFASDTAMKVTTDAVQIFGGQGFIRENEVERLMRDAKITQIYEGTNQIMRLVVSGNILR